MNAAARLICITSVMLFSLSCPLSISSASAESGKGSLQDHIRVLVKQLSQGEIFLGGKPPHLREVSVVRELKKDGLYYYRVKALVDRCSGDSDGSLVLFKARTYGDAVAKLLGIDPAKKKLFDMFFPKSIDKTRFPPVLMVYKYTIVTRNAETGQLVLSRGTRKAKGKKRFIETLSQGLPPGTHELKIDVSVDIGDHPVKAMYDALEWVQFLMNPAESLSEYTEYFSVLGLGKALIKTVLANKATATQARFQITVPAKVPDLAGMKPSKAVAELQARLLNYSAKNVTDCSLHSSDKVVRQHPAPGKRVRKGTVVTLAVCRKNNARPTATPSSGDKYAAWISPDKLTCCTSPEGVLTYAYQGGLQKNMPANGILLKGGFSTEGALQTWVCSRPVYSHYWAGNWASINGYTVSSLPCQINS